MKVYSKRSSIFLLLALGSAVPASAGLSFTCDPTIDATQAGTCTYLNSTVAGLYNSTFSNVNAEIYIQMGITGLGESTTGFYNTLSYSQYLADLTANASASGNSIQLQAVAALNSLDTAIYGSNTVVITSALGEALGVPHIDLTGTRADGSACTIGAPGCYNGIITITTPANLASETGGQGLYWDQQGGTEPHNDYDFYSVVEHETDEILGTASCISTTDGSGLTNPCVDNFGAGTPSAVDLFRYLGLDDIVADSALSTAGGAYFSYNGGATNGANGFIYNTAANGNDYADFLSNCGVGPYTIQDAQGCPGTDQGESIRNDGGAEVNILNAVGFDEAAPEPGTLGLFGFGSTALAFIASRRRRLSQLTK